MTNESDLRWRAKWRASSDGLHVSKFYMQSYKIVSKAEDVQVGFTFEICHI